MAKKERIVWIIAVSALLFISLFGIFVNDAFAGSVSSEFPYIQKFLSVFNSIKKEYVDEEKIDDKKLINGAIKGMLEAIGDPHTNYLSDKDMNDMNDTSSGNFGGVGMIIQSKDDYIVVVSPIEGTPAYRKGMKSGDLLISVDGQSLKGVEVNEAANRLRGVPGTSVKVEFIREEIKYEVEIVRAIIDVPSVKHTTIKDKYGYLRITHFTGTTDGYVKKALKEFTDKNITGIIVDLRANPGGLLSQVINIVDYFQDEGDIVSTKGRNYQNSVNKASRINTIVKNEIPVIVLVDNGSASASEIFSGAIKDLNRGILIGEKTYGKGSVQTIHQLGSDGFKITIAKYYTPANISIDGIGIEPHIEVKEPELSEEQKLLLQKMFKDKAVENIVKSVKNPTGVEIESMTKQLAVSGYDLPARYLKKLIKNELEITSENKEIYDLEYDLQLQKALEVLEGNLLEYKDGKYYLKK